MDKGGILFEPCQGMRPSNDVGIHQGTQERSERLMYDHMTCKGKGKSKGIEVRAYWERWRRQRQRNGGGRGTSGGPGCG